MEEIKVLAIKCPNTGKLIVLPNQMTAEGSIDSDFNNETVMCPNCHQEHLINTEDVVLLTELPDSESSDAP